MNPGIHTPLVTPLAGPDSLDAASLERLINHVIAGGVHGIFLLGTTGEGPLLSASLRAEVVRLSADFISGRVPLVVNVTGPSSTENLALACTAARAGASAVAYAGPLYAPLSQDALAAHVERFAGQCPLPIVLYNMPSHTNIFFEVATVVRLAVNEGIIALKDSSGKLLYLQKLSRMLGGDFPLFVGPEEMLYPALLGGAAGGVNGGSNLFPRLFVGIWAAVASGNWGEAARLQNVALALSEAVYSEGYLRGLKAAMAARGLCTAIMAEPELPLAADAAHRIARAILHPDFPS